MLLIGHFLLFLLFMERADSDGKDRHESGNENLATAIYDFDADILGLKPKSYFPEHYTPRESTVILASFLNNLHHKKFQSTLWCHPLSFPNFSILNLVPALNLGNILSVKLPKTILKTMWT